MPRNGVLNHLLETQELSVPGSSTLEAPPSVNGIPSPISVIDKDCFLGADGAEYCVADSEPLVVVQGSTVTGDATRMGVPDEVGLGTGARRSTPAFGAMVGDRDSSGALSLYAMMGMCFLVATVCALDRVAMSVAIVPMAQAYGYTDTTKGLVSLWIVTEVSLDVPGWIFTVCERFSVRSGKASMGNRGSCGFHP